MNNDEVGGWALLPVQPLKVSNEENGQECPSYKTNGESIDHANLNLDVGHRHLLGTRISSLRGG